MSAQRPDPMLDRLAALAREQEPPDLDRDAAQALVRSAMRSAGQSPEKASWFSPFRLAIAAAIIFVPSAIGAMILLFGDVESNDSQMLRASLPTGDRLVATAGAQFEVESATEELRQVSVSNGTVLFDVEPLADGERFEVVTDHLAVEVRGTVFSVETVDDRSVVRVYEGRVEVTQESLRSHVGARQMWVSNVRSTRPVDDGPLSAVGEEAAQMREAVASVEEQAPESSDTVAQAIASGPDDIGERARSIPEQIGQLQPLSGGGRAESPRTPAQRVSLEERERPAAPTADAGTSVRSEERSIEEDAQIPSTITMARQALIRGDSERALAAARVQSGSEWRMLEADALRSLRRYTESADAYDRVVTGSPGSNASQAGYLAAYIRSRHLGDASGALASLEQSGAERPGSPLAERALALRARVLHQAGRTAEARQVASDYLRRYPEGGMASWMGALLGQTETEEP